MRTIAKEGTIDRDCFKGVRRQPDHAPRLAIADGVRRRKGQSATLPKIVSLFSGAGGLGLGFKEAGYSISVAFDSADAAIRTHRKNFPRTKAIIADLSEIKSLGVLEQVKAKLPAGQRIGVIGGPPCQGFSRANAGAQTDDPRNKLPTLYLDIVRELQSIYIVEFVVFENVLGIRDKKHAATYKVLAII